MASLLLKELVFILDSPPNLTRFQINIMEEAYSTSVRNLKNCLQGTLGNIFLELFENELRTFRQINVDRLITEESSPLLLPVSTTPLSGIALSRRLPSGGSEQIQQCVQRFLVLRELKYTMLNNKDDGLPLREHFANFKPKDTISLGHLEPLDVTMILGPTKRRLKRLLVLDSGFLLVVEGDPKSTKSACGNVCNVVPLQNLEVETDAQDDAVLHLISHPMTWSAVFVFDDAAGATGAQQKLKTEKDKVRSEKMEQILHLLDTDNDVF